jgi:hypothetical protein
MPPGDLLRRLAGFIASDADAVPARRPPPTDVFPAMPPDASEKARSSLRGLHPAAYSGALDEAGFEVQTRTYGRQRPIPYLVHRDSRIVASAESVVPGTGRYLLAVMRPSQAAGLGFEPPACTEESLLRLVRTYRAVLKPILQEMDRGGDPITDWSDLSFLLANVTRSPDPDDRPLAYAIRSVAGLDVGYLGVEAALGSKNASGTVVADSTMAGSQPVLHCAVAAGLVDRRLSHASLVERFGTSFRDHARRQSRSKDPSSGLPPEVMAFMSRPKPSPLPLAVLAQQAGQSERGRGDSS